MNNKETRNLAKVVMANAVTIWNRKMAEVPIDCMVVDDDTYQRKVRDNAKRIASHWDAEKCDNLLLSYRDGIFHVIDGQHRMEAAKIIGVETLPATILEGLTVQQEALLFAKQKENVSILTPYDTFKASIACGDRNIPSVNIDMQIDEICKKYKVRITQTNGYGLTSLTRARHICKQSKYVFDKIISLLTEVGYDKQKKGISSSILTGLYRVSVMTDDLDLAYKNLKEYMLNHGVNEVIHNARERFPGLPEESAVGNYLVDVSRENNSLL